MQPKANVEQGSIVSSSLEDFMIVEEPFYRASGDELELFEAAYEMRIPVMLKGPTGCGKTRFVEHMAWRLGRPLIRPHASAQRDVGFFVRVFYSHALSATEPNDIDGKRASERTTICGSRRGLFIFGRIGRSTAEAYSRDRNRGRVLGMATTSTGGT